mmetsp:Transcript_486/g.1577  ORF Transcript_486/g.1577 Transcript_486/m.1577 type:complete len:366 (-) Transcript_486:34-1131(-)
MLGLLLVAALAAPPRPPDPRFGWIAAIEQSGGVHQLSPGTYFIDRQYKLPDGTQIVGAGGGGVSNGTTIMAVATNAAQQGGHFHGCGLNHVNRIGFVLGSHCRIADMHFVGIERSRYPDSHPLCGGAPFETPGCATAFCTSVNGTTYVVGGGRAIRDSVVENVTVAGGTVQNGFWMPQTPGDTYCENITVRHLTVLGSCAQPGPCPPSTSSDGGGTWADGINVHGAHRDILVEANRIPHTGDDGFALWSKGSTETNVTFRGNYAASPRYPRTWLASCYAMYGGTTAAFVGNSCVQTGSRGALYLADGFGGNFEPNVSFVDVVGNNFTGCCPICPHPCGVHGAVNAPGCHNISTDGGTRPVIVAQQ